jgi:TPR repeat protein
MTGKGVTRDPQRASIYYEKAANFGIPEAQFVMGELLRVGVDVPQNIEGSRNWYKLALKNGYHAAQERLEQMEAGVGIQARTGPTVTAVVYENLQDIPREQLMAEGLEYFIGDKRPQNLKKAAEFIEMAAQKGLADAQYMIGRMCMGGQGLNKNKERALFWLKKAAEQDHPDSAFEVAKFYDNGNCGRQRYISC